MYNKHNGYVVWKGKSRLDGKPIVVIVTGVGAPSKRSKNVKTGQMAQVWVLRSDINPIEAISSGRDESICGSCPLRGIIEKVGRRKTNRMRACYVEVDKAPLAVWKSYKAGNYPAITDDVQWEDQATRLCAYGDSAAIPYAVSRNLISRGNGKHTGYTHSKLQHAQPLRKMLMASVHSEEEAKEMHDKGWRTFRTMAPGDTLMPNEIMCPASEEQGKRLTCETCLACSGTGDKESRKNAVSVAIFAHGSPSKLSSYSKTFSELPVIN